MNFRIVLQYCYLSTYNMVRIHFGFNSNTDLITNKIAGRKIKFFKLKIRKKKPLCISVCYKKRYETRSPIVK